MSQDAGREMADISMANSLRRLVPIDLYADFFKNVPHRVKRCIIIDQVGLRIWHDLNRQKLEQQGPHGHTLCGDFSEAARTRELNALKGERKGFKAQCFHCGQHGHRLSAYQKKDADMMKGKGKMKGFSEGKNPPQQRQQYGKGKGWYWSESWSET